MTPEDLITREMVDLAALSVSRYYVRMWGAPWKYAISDGSLDWNDPPVVTEGSESELRDLCRKMNARAALIAIVPMLAEEFAKMADEEVGAGEAASLVASGDVEWARADAWIKCARRLAETFRSVKGLSI